MNFSNTVVTPPPLRTFDPQTPPVLRNVEQYQQPTLGSQLYNVSNSFLISNSILSCICGYLWIKTRLSVFQTTTNLMNPPYQPTPPAPSQMGLGHNQNLSQVVAPTPSPMGFMPVPSSGGVQRPGMGSMQPPSPPQAQPVQPAASPAAPPPTVQTADTSKVPGNLSFR